MKKKSFILSIIEFFTDHWARFGIAFFIGIVPVIVYNAVYNNWLLVINYCNGFFIGAASLLAVSALSVFNLYGAFDIFSYLPGRKKMENGKIETLYDYSERKKLTRGKFKLVFVPYLVVGVVFLLVSLILYFNI